MITLLALTLLSQTCSVTDSIVCPGPIAAPRGQFYIVEPYGSSAGNALQSHRAYNDGDADLTLLPKSGVCRNPDTLAVSLQDCYGHDLLRVLNSGEVQAGSQGSAASFTDLSTEDGHPFGRCLPAYIPTDAGDIGGCYLNFQSDMAPANLSAFHGGINWGNVRERDGGLALQLQGGRHKTGSASAEYPGTTTAIDIFGNLILRDGWVYQQLRTADRGACATSGTTAFWDGEWHQAGAYGYDADEDALVFRSSAQCAADGGLEHIITDRSLTARLATLEDRITALEALCQ